MAQIATILFIAGIAGLFVLDRDREGRTSKALWIPVVYLLITGSRPVSMWFGINQRASAVNGIYASPIDRLVDLVLLTAGLIVVLARSRRVGRLLRENVPILLFFSLAALSILWSDFPYVTFKHWTKGIEDVVMALIVLTDLDPEMAIKRLLTRAGFILIPLSLLFSKYYPRIGHIYTIGGALEYVGVSTQKNQLGMICLVFGLGSWWCFLKAYRDRESVFRSRHMLAHGAMLGIIGWLLQMCNSVTAIVSLILAGAVMLLVSRRSLAPKTAKVHILVTAVACISLFPLFVDPTLVGMVGRSTTFSGRTDLWHVLPGFVRHPWIGAGYQTFLVGPRLVELQKIFGKTFQEAHNGYLEVYLNLGWIGVSLFALLVITGYRKIVAAFQRDPSLGSLALAFFVAAMVSGLTEAVFRMMDPRWFFLLWAIFAASQIVSNKAEAMVAVQASGSPERGPGQAVPVGAAAPAVAVERYR